MKKQLSKDVLIHCLAFLKNNFLHPFFGKQLIPGVRELSFISLFYDANKKKFAEGFLFYLFNYSLLVTANETYFVTTWQKYTKSNPAFKQQQFYSEIQS